MDDNSVSKNNKGKLISSEKKSVIANLFHSIKSSSNRNRSNRSISQDLNVSTGIGQRSIYNFLQGYSRNGIITSPNRKRNKGGSYKDMTDQDKENIRRIVHSFFFEKKIPTLRKVLSRMREQDHLPLIGKSSLDKVMEDLQFKYRKNQRKSMLLERSDIVCWRRDYLRQIKRHRLDGRTIYYTDETWVNVGTTTSRCWQDTTVQSARDAALRGLSTGTDSQFRSSLVHKIRFLKIAGS